MILVATHCKNPAEYPVQFVQYKKKEPPGKIQGGWCIKKERAGYSLMNLFIMVA